MTSTPPAAPAAPVVGADDALRAGKPPVGTGSSPLFAQLVALAFIGLGVVAVQHLLVQLGAVDATSWLANTVDAADGITGSSFLVLLVGIVAAVLGVLLLPVVFKPRPRKGVALTANTGVHLHPRDVARIAESTLEDVDAITRVKAKARRRRLRVVATTIAGKERNAAIASDLEGRLSSALTALEHQPRVTVTVRNEAS